MVVVVLVLAGIAVQGAPSRAVEPTPVQQQIRHLERAIADYRTVETRGGWQVLDDGPVLRQGMSGNTVADLRRRLVLAGDLGGTAEDARYDPEVTEAVKRFQKRHGLVADGRVGPHTLAALNVPVATRIAQLELNRQRLQSLPDLGSSYIQVNAAAATLEVIDQHRLVMDMPVIVGDKHHPTPVFHSHAAEVVFYPPWNVPHSIAVREILPRLRRDPGYLATNEIRILNRPDDPFGFQVNWKTMKAGAFRFQLQQQPGPRNALGLVKFHIPNEFDIYLHDTPTKALFQQSTRALSHGCVRVSKPRELAAWLLGSQGWSDEDVETALDAYRTRHVPIDRFIPVHVLYFTAFVDAQGLVNFREDIYGRDAQALIAGVLKPKPPQLAEATRIGCRDTG